MSFLLHALVIYLAIRLTAAVAMPEHSPIGDAIQMVLGGGGGGGGQSGQAFQKSTTPPPPPTVTPPVVPPPTPSIVPPPPTPQPVPPPPAAAASSDPNPSSTVASAGTGTGTGGGNGTGTGIGNGSGVGAGSGSGTGGGNGNGRGGSPPKEKQIVVPDLNPPKKMRGQTIEVTFQVAADGFVTNIVVTPPVADKDWAKKLDGALRNFRFTPAKDPDGKPIAGVIKMQFTF